MLTAKRRTDSAAARTNQSPRTPEEEIPVGSKNTKLNPQVLLRQQFWIKGSSRGSSKGLVPLKKWKIKWEMMCLIYRVIYTPKRMKMGIWFSPNIPLDSVDSWFRVSERANPMKRTKSLIRRKTKRKMVVTPMLMPPWWFLLTSRAKLDWKLLTERWTWLLRQHQDIWSGQKPLVTTRIW